MNTVSSFIMINGALFSLYSYNIKEETNSYIKTFI